MKKTLRSLTFGFTLFALPIAAQHGPAKPHSGAQTWNASLALPAEATASEAFPPQDLHTRFLFIVTTDGLRWQELFGGADSSLLFDPVTRALDTIGAVQRFWAPTAVERRRALMPFVWSKLAREGQLYGNRLYGNHVDVSNRWAFSYPGYNELLTGRPDNFRVFSNFKLRNPNKNVLEFFQRQECLRGDVVAFASWTAFPYILNARRSKLPVHSGAANRRLCRRGEKPGKEHALDDLYTWEAAMNYTREKHPAVVYIGLNATDLMAHHGNYPGYLEAAHRLDTYLAQLWSFIENDPLYRGRTTVLISTDHGRGGGSLYDWSNHNRHIEGSEAIWLAAIGPDTPALGEVHTPMQLWQKQFAQTAAHVLGLEFRRGKKVAPAIATIYTDPEVGRWTVRGGGKAGTAKK